MSGNPCICFFSSCFKNIASFPTLDTWKIFRVRRGDPGFSAVSLNHKNIDFTQAYYGVITLKEVNCFWVIFGCWLRVLWKWPCTEIKVRCNSGFQIIYLLVCGVYNLAMWEKWGRTRENGWDAAIVVVVNFNRLTVKFLNGHPSLSEYKKIWPGTTSVRTSDLSSGRNRTV